MNQTTKASLLVGALLALLTSPAAAAPPKGLVLTLHLPRISGNRPCGGLCGLKWGDKVRGSLTLRNKSKRPLKIAIELSCSGLTADLLFHGPRGKTKALPRPHRVDLSRKRSCRKNAPRWLTLAAGAKLERSFRFEVPRLGALKYDVMLEALVYRPNVKRQLQLRSVSLRRLVHR